MLLYILLFVNLVFSIKNVTINKVLKKVKGLQSEEGII